MVRCSLGRSLLVALILLSMMPLAQGAKLVGIVSARSAPELSAAAHDFHESFPGHELVLRTPQQLAGEPDAAIAALWKDADAVLFGAVFGEITPRLLRLLESHPPRSDATLFAVSGDRRLTTISRFGGRQPLIDLNFEVLDALTSQPAADALLSEHFSQLTQRYPDQATWIEGRYYWQARGSENLRGLIQWLLEPHDDSLERSPPVERSSVRYRVDGQTRSAETLQLHPDQQTIAVFDHDTGDQIGQRDVHDAFAKAFEGTDLQCVSVLAQWGEPSVEAIKTLEERLAPSQVIGIIMLQDFVIGGGEGREEATQAFGQLDVPVLKGICLTDRTETQWRQSSDGLPWDSVHYRVAMPELQGQSQPTVVAASKPPSIDELTGVSLRVVHPIGEQIEHLCRRLKNWHSLRTAANADKKIGVIFYNHPPGRHNIGADNLDVVDSLFDLLHEMKHRGYTVGELPESPEELLDQLQAQAVNLPENREALSAMSERIVTVSTDQYLKWFQTLPSVVRGEMIDGPLAALSRNVRDALEAEQVEIAQDLIEQRIGDVHHLLEGVEHRSKERALDLLDQLETAYGSILDGEDDWEVIEQLTAALGRTGIEALRGWGEPPGRVMVHQEKLLIPGIRFGNVFVGPQPPRGWELEEELLHANTTFPPPHQYIAFYQWLHKDFEADALVHFGRHSTYEFLPGHRVGMAEADYSKIIAGDLPGIYPYIVDGVGEGIQAKRRGLAVMVDHLTPPLRTTPLYDDLLELRQLVESYESASSGGSETPAQRRAIQEIRRLVEQLDLKPALIANMQDVLEPRGIGYEQLEGHLLVHEVGHYLTTMQEDFMPMGLHVFGRPWDEEAIDTMIESIGDSSGEETRQKLTESPRHEMAALLDGLDGRFIAPGSGNDPIRSPEVLPTGRNFHALNSSLIPTKLAWKLGSEMAGEAKGGHTQSGSEAVVLWASDTVRDDGAMVAFGLSMYGVQPEWNSRGILNGLQRMELPEGHLRRDVVFTTSGLFRDLYQNLLVWLDRAALLALDASSEQVQRQHPQLQSALSAALAPLGELRDPGNEPIETNRVAGHWVAAVQASVAEGDNPETAGRRAALRVFGDAPGAYGAGVNRLAERSGAWQSRDELADAYLHRMGHAYGDGVDGETAHDVFKQALGSVERTYLGRASNLYGLLDNNDAFDYLGGLNLGVESASGKPPRNRVVDHSNPDRPSVKPLESAILSELQGRYLNPAWIKPLMGHDYAGARTMGTNFLENFWGWQVTNPEIITDQMWDEIKSVYIDDKHDLGLDEFLEEGANVHVKSNMLAVMLVAMQKQFWDAEPETVQQIAREFARLASEHGLPGSGHTRPDHPMLEWIEPKLTPELKEQLRRVRAAARIAAPTATTDPAAIREIEMAETQSPPAESEQPLEIKERPQQPAEPASTDWTVIFAAVLGLLALIGGLLVGVRGAKRPS